MACSHLKGCELFAEFALNPALYVWQTEYCEGEFKRCVRYRRSNSGEIVPLTLLPNGKIVTMDRSEQEMGITVLLNAIQKDRHWMVGTLVTKVGVDINAASLEGITALMLAADHGNEKIVKILLDHGADASLRNIEGETAYDIAARKGHQNILALLPG